MMQHTVKTPTTELRVQVESASALACSTNASLEIGQPIAHYIHTGSENASCDAGAHKQDPYLTRVYHLLKITKDSRRA